MRPAEAETEGPGSPGRAAVGLEWGVESGVGAAGRAAGLFQEALARGGGACLRGPGREGWWVGVLRRPHHSTGPGGTTPREPQPPEEGARGICRRETGPCKPLMFSCCSLGLAGEKKTLK